jgi:hypothetical protein
VIIELGAAGRRRGRSPRENHLDRAVAAVDQDDLAADEVGGGRREEEDQVRDLERRSESMEGDARLDGRRLRLVAPGLLRAPRERP